MLVDVHQHVWTASLVDALASRQSLPFIVRTDGLCVLHSAGERPCVIDLGGETPARRAQLLADDRLDVAVVAISSPIGIEALPREGADQLIEAHLDGVSGLGDDFAAWGPLALDGCDPDDVDILLERGCVGISLPAGAFAGGEALDAIGPLLDRIAAREVPLFVHPGPAHASVQCEAALTEPVWWRALTDYVAQMQVAWLTFATRGRRAHPELIVVFAMLAGGAPLLTERLDARGGPAIDLADTRSFYDTSSYGPSAVQAMARRVGAAQLVYGSDRPVVEPLTNGDASLQANSARLLATRRGAA